MNLIMQIITGLLRLALAGIATWLIDRGVISADQSEMLISGIALALISIVWSLANKYGFIKKIKAALMLEAGSSEEKLKEVLKGKQEDAQN